MPYAKRKCSACSGEFRPSNDPVRTTCWPCAQKKTGNAKAVALAAEIKRPGALEPAQENRVRELLRKDAMSLEEIAEALDLRPSERGIIEKAIEGMKEAGSAIYQRADGRFSLNPDVEPGGLSEVRLGDRGDGWSVVGFVADTHLGSKHERLDVLNTLYDTFAAEGVQHVYHGGNWIDGEARFNKYSLKVFGLDNQLDYMIQNYPTRPGITTHYVTGDDHEGWYQIRECINIGERLEDKAKRAGRSDLRYLGYMEADVRLQAAGGASTPMRVMHGGGGSAYALSYKLQKIVESLTGGEKPSILSVGHYHKFCYAYVRNVHAFMPGCTKDQDVFMRKQSIEAHVGGVLAWIKQDPADGHVTRFRAEWMPFYDHGYYEKRFE
jgi:predicted phosphodiesterase/biotin operon repressor